jgi:dimethylsulfoniopropionate demethylase
LNLNKKKYFIARSGWSKQGGFEIYVEDNLAGQDLYDYLFEYGEEFNVRPGCPNLIERIESALLSYGNDFDNRDNPLEANFDKFMNLDSDANFLGKEKLKKIKHEGIKRKLMGVKIDHNKIDMYCEKTLYDDNNNIVGFVRSATYSPTFKQVIGIAMINKPYWDGKDQFKIEIGEKIFVGRVCGLPFV